MGTIDSESASEKGNGNIPPTSNNMINEGEEILMKKSQSKLKGIVNEADFGEK